MHFLNIPRLFILESSPSLQQSLDAQSCFQLWMPCSTPPALEFYRVLEAAWTTTRLKLGVILALWVQGCIP